MSLLLLDTFMPFRQEIQKKEFRAGEICSFRWVWNWSTAGIFDIDDEVPNKHSRFNYVQLVWLRVIVKMREFGLPIPDILLVKQTIASEYGTKGIHGDPSGLVNVVVKAILKCHVYIVLTKKNSGTRVQIINDIAQSVNQTSALIISIDDILMEYMLSVDKRKVEEHLTKLIRFNVMTHQQIQLFSLLHHSFIKEIIVKYNDEQKIISQITVEDYVKIIWGGKYDAIIYQHQNTTVSFNRFNEPKPKQKVKVSPTTFPNKKKMVTNKNDENKLVNATKHDFDFGID